MPRTPTAIRSRVTLTQTAAGDIAMRASRGNAYPYRILLTPDEALHLSYRLQAYARGQQTTTETIIDKEHN